MTVSKLRKTPDQIRLAKGKPQPLVCLTAYTAPMAELLDPHCDLLLVGDSVGMTLHGMDNTLSVTLEMMILHGCAVMRKAQKACVVVDMPYGTYENDPQEALNNACRIVAETQCDAVKLEGGVNLAPTIAMLTANNIPVMAHIGLLPQSVIKEGGYKIKGKTLAETATLIADAQAVERAGAFALVIEGTLTPAAQQITETVNIPTIGIGASVFCDGQILVTEDMLGFLPGHTPKFVKKYANLATQVSDAVSAYAAEVKTRQFPNAAYSYDMQIQLRNA